MVKSRKKTRKPAGTTQAAPAPQLAASGAIRGFSPVRANTYDAAQTTRLNQNHWLDADTMAAAADATPEIRKKLRNRARYEVRNNSYASGMVQTKAEDVVGRTPRLQMDTDDGAVNREIEQIWASWARAVHLGETLRLAREGISDSGDAFVVLTTDMAVKHPVKLRPVLVNADRVRSPLKLSWGTVCNSGAHYDGIDYDANGNPLRYWVTKENPDTCIGYDDEFVTYPAWQVIHLYKQHQAGQRRGIPEVTAGLPIFALLRRFCLATVNAAEHAASFSAVIEQISDYFKNEDQDAWPELDLVDIERGSMMTLPVGTVLKQFKAEHPNATFKEFKREMLNEAARTLGMPLNIALANSEGYNYSSGRLDHQAYFRTIAVDQHWLGERCLDQILRAFLAEAVRIPALISTRTRTMMRQIGSTITRVVHRWFFDGHEHVDPQKEAVAQRIRLENKTTTLAAEYARAGKDWETEMQQLAREQEIADEMEFAQLKRRKAMAEKLGLPLEQFMPAQATTLLQLPLDEDDSK